MASAAASSRSVSSGAGEGPLSSGPPSPDAAAPAAGSTPSSAPTVTPNRRLMAMSFSSSGTAASASHRLTAWRLTPSRSPRAS